jgi:hypothetical protein
MGYELNRLMRQFGVSSPTVAYSGSPIPVAPVAPGASATEEQTTAYNTLVDKYNAAKPQYEADRAAYEPYKQAYQERVMNTPQYTDAQFQTGPSAAVAWQAQQPGTQGDGREAVNQSINTWVAQNPNATPQAMRAEMEKYGISGYDAAQARGGSMWGAPLSMPSYGRTPSIEGQPGVETITMNGPPRNTGGGTLGSVPVVNAPTTLTTAATNGVGTVGGVVGVDAGSGWIGGTGGGNLGGVNAVNTTAGGTSNQPLYQSLTAQSTPAQIAAAYAQFASGAGGDNAANQREAMAFLQSRGIGDDVITNAYQQHLAPASAPVTTSAPATRSGYAPTASGAWSGASHIVDGVELVPGAPGYDPAKAAMRHAEISTYGGTAGAGAAATLRANNLYDTGMSQWQTELNRLHQQDVAAERVPVGTPPPVAAAPTTFQMPATYDQSYVNQLAREAAAQAGGTISYADAANAARNLGIPESMLQAAMSTGVIRRKHGGAVRDLARKYAVGGAVRKFQRGGAEGELEDPMEAFLLQQGIIDSEGSGPMPMPAVEGQPMAPPVARPAAPPEMQANLPPVAGRPDLMTLLGKYAPQGNTYGVELAEARKAATAETAAFNAMLQKAISEPGSQGPSKSEMYFRLAAAFGAPTKTGAFSENLAKAGEVLSEQKKAVREASSAERARKLQLGLQAQQAKMAGAKEDLGTLRTLAGEEMKDKRTIAAELLKDYVRSGQPQSSAGKQALDEGLRPGTPEYQKRVGQISELNVDRQMGQIQATLANLGLAQANAALQGQKFEFQQEQASKLTAPEMKLKTETEDLLAQAAQGYKELKRALALNPNTFDTSLVDTAQRKALEAVGSKDPKVVNTRELENVLQKAALSQLKATFGGAISDGERTSLQATQGMESKSIEERARIMQNAADALKSIYARNKKRLNEINQGAYRATQMPGEE